MEISLLIFYEKRQPLKNLVDICCLPQTKNEASFTVFYHTLYILDYTNEINFDKFD